MKKLTSKEKEALKKIPDYSKLLQVSHGYDFIEFVVNRYGDINTYRVYNDGKVYER